MKLIKLIIITFFVTSSIQTFAGKGEIKSVETTVAFQSDGKAIVNYLVKWNVLSGELHGFYFQGNDKLRVNKFLKENLL